MLAALRHIRQPPSFGVLQAAGSNLVNVRIAAMQALESTGGASVVPLLLETAARTRGDDQAAARSTLGMLKGRLR